MSLFKKYTTDSPGSKYLMFDISLDYIPLVLANKVKIGAAYPTLPATHFTIKNWDHDKRLAISRKYNEIFNKNMRTDIGVIFHNYLRTNGLLQGLKLFKENIDNIIDYQLLDYDNLVFVKNNINDSISYLSNHFKNPNIKNVSYGSGDNRTSSLVGQYFIADNFNNHSCDISYVLMIQKDYYKEFMLRELLNKPIDISKLQWWVDSKNLTRLNTYKKRAYSAIVKIIKETQFEIVGKDNINDILLSYNKPVVHTISAINDFNKLLTDHVMNEIYNFNNPLEELKLSIKKPNVVSVKLKGMKLPKPKVVVPQLVD